MQPCHTVRSSRRAAGDVERGRRHVEHGDVVEAASEELVDEWGAATADVDHRGRRLDAECSISSSDIVGWAWYHDTCLAPICS